jgi:hypothetical protein
MPQSKPLSVLMRRTFVIYQTEIESSFCIQLSSNAAVSHYMKLASKFPYTRADFPKTASHHSLGYGATA